MTALRIAVTSAMAAILAISLVPAIPAAAAGAEFPTTSTFVTKKADTVPFGSD